MPPEGLETAYLPLLRDLAAAAGGAEPFPRAALCLEIFRERGLLAYSREGENVRLRLLDPGGKVRLEESVYYRRLRQGPEEPREGGSDT